MITIRQMPDLPGNILKNLPSWMSSAILHMVVLMILALITCGANSEEVDLTVIASTNMDELLEELPLDVPIEVPLDIPTEITTFEAPMDIEPDVQFVEEPDGFLPGDPDLTPGLTELGNADLTARIGDGGGEGGTGLIGREKRYNRIKGTPEGKAVAMALKWLAAHQLPDGGWSFKHVVHPNCAGQCRNPGSLDESRIGATGMALLPFLGAGQTHKTGAYKDTVRAGLYFLTRNMKISPKGGEMYEKGGRMYSHGIAAIVLTEAYGMTHDKGLHGPAQASINFICYAQDPVGGGWRYEPRQAGDTSVVGWQMMALKSGHMAYLLVPPIVAKRASAYLDGVAYDSGARYGYTDGTKGSDATSAIGLLCRMYLGWQKDDPALQRGVAWISAKGPSSNFYYNYYASQVMRHWEGEDWEKWYDVMGDQLVNSQAQAGHEKGSWWSKGSHGPDTGGRLYCTSMATMILEVPYRHLPIFKGQAVEEDFPE